MAFSPKFIPNWPKIFKINVPEHHPLNMLIKHVVCFSHVLIVGAESHKIYKKLKFKIVLFSKYIK